MKRFDALKRFLEAQTGKPLESLEPIGLSPEDVMRALWPLNKQVAAAASEIACDSRYGTEVDATLEFMGRDGLRALETLSSGGLRLLRERYLQAMAMAKANEHAGTRIMVHLPRGLTAVQTTIAVALFLLHGMELDATPDAKREH
ncbi:hypothetical protein HW532_18970 [Kaustia mangrovi]|uniref:Uncharacterized protein n=1 Tax=Kaustia mangrovi TaxID=2593653 RepID=A0A7S8C728_9HYPH|nr:hypothetical protein [Kaustia mangrovi]QPC44600.1 hypothetical protein HW532_18970 [Kaustia mangrovi]